MTTKARNPLAHLEVIRAAPEERPILENLLELYIPDFSQFHSVDVGPDGKFGYPDLPLYWLEPERHPFLARMNGKLAGFALVRRVASIHDKKTVWTWRSFLFFAECASAGLERNWRKPFGRCFRARGRCA